MRRGKPGGSLALLAGALMVATAPWASGTASASCAAPYLRIGEDDPHPVVQREAPITVQGRAFVLGCNDTGSSTGGCSAGQDPAEMPMKNVVLSIHQGSREWRLGSADAGTAENNQLGHVTWTVTMPTGLEAGRATLTADGSGPLMVDVQRK